MRAAIVLAALLGLPGASAVYEYRAAHYRQVHESLVEGHTTFALLETTLCIENHGDEERERWRSNCTIRNPRRSGTDEESHYSVTVQRMGTAVAVLVRDRVKPYYEPPVLPGCSSNKDLVATLLYESPGVLWFNDRFLVGDDLDLVEAEVDANADVCARAARLDTTFAAGDWRYPCGGWVFATQAGNPDPRGVAEWAYTESYRFEDPNGYVWVVDKYDLLVGLGAPLRPEFHHERNSGSYGRYNNRTVHVGPADPSVGHLGYYLSAYSLWTVPVLGVDARDPGPESGASCPAYADAAPHDVAPYGDGDDGTPRRYNAVLFFFLEDLLRGALLDPALDALEGRAPGVPAKVHGNGTVDDGDATGCEAGTEWGCGGAPAPRTDDEEGNSHPYNPNSTDSGPVHVHPTSSVDLYFSNEPPPPAIERRYAVYDTIGAGAPYHAHEDEAFDDRVRVERCNDEDRREETTTYVWNGTSRAWEPVDYDSTHYERRRDGDGESPTDGVDDDDCRYGNP